MIRYDDSANGVEPHQLSGFFESWRNHPTPETHLELLHRSDAVVLAIDTETNAVVGFVTAISDGVLAAYIPLLEVLPAYRNRGVGTELVTRVVDRLCDLYMVDVVCDAPLLPFYETLGFRAGTAAVIRRHARQGGASAPALTA
jgi:ribosomal protein S18 acetylase RimI-like enzyme